MYAFSAQSTTYSAAVAALSASQNPQTLPCLLSTQQHKKQAHTQQSHACCALPASCTLSYTLQGMASAFRKADTLNLLNPDSPPLFPKGSQAIRPASVSLPVEASTSSVTAKEPKLSSLVAFPPNMMLFPFGQSTAAIADVMDVSYDEASPTVTMQLDVVHNPVVFSQFLEHTPCSANTTEAHYHFATRPGMDVDAPALLQALKESSYQVEGEGVGYRKRFTVVWL